MHLSRVMIVGGLMLACGPALAASPRGVWRVEDGSGNVTIGNCGRALCGYAGGQTVLQHMARRQGNVWAGTMIDIRGGGAEYDGTISLIDPNTLKIRGCMQGGGMCGDQTWTRAR